MPIPGGEITTTEIWIPEQPEPPLPEEPTEVEEKEEMRELSEDERLDISIKISKGEL